MTAPATDAPAVKGGYPWLDNMHPIYTGSRELWRENERRLRGGKLAIESELIPFDWESGGEDGPTQFAARKKLAHYENLPDDFASLIAGHLMRGAPTPDHGLSFGALGQVRRLEDVTTPSQAELIYYNVDGTANDGAQWDNFWARELRFAMATGHRWEFVDAPPTAPTTLADEQRGLRPYIRGFSPLNVTDWYFENGQLAYAILRLVRRKPSTQAQAAPVTLPGYLLLVRAGFDAFGSEFAGGGWWRFDDRKILVPGEYGDWSKTRGEIPLFPLFYQRDEQDGEVEPTSGTQLMPPALSRPALTELGQLAVVLLNITSAQRFDAWDAAKSVTWFLGAEKGAFNLAIAKMKEGSRYIPLPQAPGADGSRGGMAIQDSAAGVVSATVFATILSDLRSTAAQVALQEAAGSPGASGDSKEATFSHRIGGRLAEIASELENAQNTALYFLALRFGASPNGQVRWPRKFDLLALIDRLQQFFTAEATAGVSSKTADALALGQLVEELNITQDDALLAKIKAELLESAATAATTRDRFGAALSALRGGGGVSGNGGTPPAEPAPARPGAGIIP